ncbi:peptidoglycan-binding protein [Kitasatospora sp. NPDC056327]|uniref:peptidoglycan-binding protein n=1 Tax=Kitasatospora sp. NPDC056327 TaxID=3345785 RepID=UPI0035DF8A9D
MPRTDQLSPLLEFDDVEPGDDCICGGCNARRRARLHAAPVHEGGHAAARSVRRRAAVLMAAVGTALGGGAAGAATAAAAPAPTPTPGGPASPRAGTPQGEVSGLFGGSASARSFAAPRIATPATTRARIIERAQRWVDQKVPYSMSRYWSDGYRQDCSGFVSMAWGLGSSQTTWTLPDVAERISRDDLQPGDILVYNNPASPQSGSHVTIFGGWADSARTHYTAYEQTAPATLKRSTPYAYWNNSASYVPYRYKGLSTGGNGGGSTGGGSSDGTASTAFPGADRFGPGADNAYVTRLGQMLVQRGGGQFYTQGPGPRWGEADRRATEAFQLAQGWRGSEADGIPGRATWDLLVNGKGRNIDGGTPLPPPPVQPPATGGTGAPAFPGADRFAPGAANDWVRQLGEQLVRKGFGRYYTTGPGPRWTEADRRNVQAFQEAQGWRGAEADGYPGPDTWKRLFS